MDQHQVDVVGPEFLQGCVNGGSGLFIPAAADPDLVRQEQLFPGDAALGDRLSHTLLVEIALGRVDAPVAHRQGLQHTALRVLRRDLIGPVPQHGDLDSVAQSGIFHRRFLLFWFGWLYFSAVFLDRE